MILKNIIGFYRILKSILVNVLILKFIDRYRHVLVSDSRTVGTENKQIEKLNVFLHLNALNGPI